MNLPDWKGIRWLFSKERHDEATKILWKACKMNGTAMSQQTLETLHERIEIKDEESKAMKSSNVRSNWREKISMRALMQIANLAYCWFAVVFVYYGLNLNSVYLEYWNKYINFIVSIFIQFIILLPVWWAKQIVHDWVYSFH